MNRPTLKDFHQPYTTEYASALDKYIDHLESSASTKEAPCEICGSNNEHVFDNPNCDCYEKNCKDINTKTSEKDLGLILGNIIYLKMLSIRQDDGYSLSCKTRMSVKDAIVKEFLKQFANTLTKSKTDWISVEDRLPKEDKHVLTYSNIAGQNITTFGSPLSGQYPPSHWQLLPSPPNQNKDTK